MSKKDDYIRTTLYLKKELRTRIEEEAALQRRTITETVNGLIHHALYMINAQRASKLPTMSDEEVGRVIKEMSERVALERKK